MLSKIGVIVEELIGLREMKVINKWAYYITWVALVFAMFYFEFK